MSETRVIPPIRAFVHQSTVCVVLLAAMTRAVALADPHLTASTKPAQTTPAADILPAHDVIRLADLEDLYDPVPFDHRMHMNMASMSSGCTTCHHHTPQGQQPAACRTCHQDASRRSSMNMPGLKGAYHRQCMSCHREWSGNTACGACHEPKQIRGVLYELGSRSDMTTVVSRKASLTKQQDTYVYNTSHTPSPVVTFHHGDHARSYGLQCVECHHGDSCTKCHVAASQRRSPASRRAMSDLKNGCMNCHTDSNCGLCHDQTERPRFDHAISTGWSLEPNHSGVQCRECHGSSRDFAVPSRSCHGCHAQVRARPGPDSLVSTHADSPAMEANCFSCHTSVCKRFEKATTIHAPAASEAGCTTCHDLTAATSPLPASNQQQQLCLRCHDKTLESKRGAPIANIAALLADNPNHHGPVREGNCTACHNPHASDHAHLLVRGYADEFYSTFSLPQYALCFGCHDQEKIMSESAVGLTGFSDGDRNLHWLHVNREKGRTCRVCHEVHASKRPFHIRENVPFSGSGWMLPINYEQNQSGGRCAPGCHVAKSYDRRPERAPLKPQAAVQSPPERQHAAAPKK